MASQRMIVGIGDALLCDMPEGAAPAGLAVETALHASGLGHAGIVIARLGQDRAADEILSCLRAAGITTEHLQSDPDLPTGRLTIRRLAGAATRTISPRAAFDNLQWDFDLVDVAHQADAVVFSELGRREAQSRSIIKRFLAECATVGRALTIYDLSVRSSEAVNRLDARSGIEMAQVLIADSQGLAAFITGGQQRPVQELAAEVGRIGPVAIVVGVDRLGGKETLSLHTNEHSEVSKQPHDQSAHAAAVVGLVHGLLEGREPAGCLAQSAETAQRAVKGGS